MNAPQRAIVFAPLENSEGKRDATGAFIPEARAFMRVHSLAGGVRLFDNRRQMRERFCQVRDWIEDEQPLTVDTVALFCHGWKDGLQIGARIEDARKLALSLISVCVPDVRILLYCCDTARDADDDRIDDTQPGPGGEGGMADALRDELRKAGFRATIWGHTTAGHTTRNPYVRRFDPGEVAGGHWVIEPHSPLWLPWVRALRGDMRFRFPFMSQVEIETELHGVEVA